MMISISTILSREPGNVILKGDADTQIKTNAARVISVPTLDGGSVVVHSGSSIKDRPLTVRGLVTKEQEEILWDFFRTQDYLLFATGNKLMKVAISRLKTDGGNLEMDLIIYSEDN